jgi:branched-chain amino acid transport system ATP-binding protein
VLELQTVTGGYGGVVVLRDLSISVPDASIVALLGPNGAGKTTTLKMASGLLRPRTGRVMLNGSDVTRSSPAQRVRQGLCHVIEGRGVFPSLTVRENLRLFSPKGRESESFDEVAEAFPILGQRRHQQAGTLSGGEQQILALTRAYLSGARIVLVDEASLGLAPMIVDVIFAFLERLARGGMSLLLVEQYVARALALADSVYVMQQGEVVFQGGASDLDEERLFALYSGEPN